jgi:hypothetical protein
MLGSDHDGERAAAGLKAHEFLKGHGLTWRDVIAVPFAVAQPQDQPPRWRVKLAACAAHQHYLNSREREFVRSMQHWCGTPSPKQLSWLDRIFENLPP